MWRFRSRIVYLSCIALYLLSLYTLAEAEKQCDTGDLSDLNNCGENRRCVQKHAGEKGVCECIQGAKLMNDKCVIVPSTESPSSEAVNIRPDPKPSSRGGSVAAGLLIPTFLILLSAAAYYAAKRYKWVQRFRQFRQNRYGNVLVTRDDTDDDDPPIS